MSTHVVLITGALTGTGRAAALAFAREGHRIVVAGRHEQAGQDLATELRALGTEVEFLRADIRHEDDVRNLLYRTVTRFGRLDAAVQSENERYKTVVGDQFFKAGIQGHLTTFALHPDFTVTAPNRLPWGGRYAGAAFLRGSESLRHSGRARKTANDFGSHRAHDDDSDDREGS